MPELANQNPWYVPGKWLAPPTFWDPDLQSNLPNKPDQVRLVDCTLVEGPDAVGCHLSWKSRIELAMKLDEVGVEVITTPGGCSHRETSDWIREVRKRGVSASILNKLAVWTYPLRPGWKEILDKQFEIGGDQCVIHTRWVWKDVISDYTGSNTKESIVQGIQEVIQYAKSRGVTPIYSHGDTMRHRLSTDLLFYKSAIEAGAEGIYIWDSRGNCNPVVAYHAVKKFKEITGPRPIFIQFHNDLGMATGNSFAAAMAGASMLDCSILGIGDRGGCVALEEIACALEMYDVKTNIKLEKLYELSKLAEDAFSVKTQLWKPIVGSGAFMENGWGHKAPGDPDETSAGLAPSVVGRDHFQSMMGGRVFSERDDRFWTDMLREWGYSYTESDLSEIKERTMHAIISRRGAIDIDEFHQICDGVVGTGAS